MFPSLGLKWSMRKDENQLKRLGDVPVGGETKLGILTKEHESRAAPYPPTLSKVSSPKKHGCC